MRKLLLLIAVVIGMGPLTANAVPTLYNVAFTANLGPSGTGSFVFDNDVGTLTDFGWDFGGIVGGPGDFGTAPAFGDTLGRFMFEILSETDVHAVSNCINVACTVSGLLQGDAPGGASFFRFAGTAAPGSSDYRFYTAPGDVFGSTVASGSIAIARAVAVPEPTSLSLLGLGLLGVVALRRRLRA